LATIREARPELLDKYAGPLGNPIPTKPPDQYFFKDAGEIPDIGQATTAGFFVLSNIDPTGW